MYNTAVTIRQGAKTDTDDKVLKTKLSLNWTGPYNVVAIGPCTPADTPDGSPVSAKRLHWIYPPTCPVRMLAGASQYNASSPVPTPTTMPTSRSIFQRSGSNMRSTIDPRNPPRTMSLKKMFRFLFNNSMWRRSPDTNRFAVEVGTRRAGPASLDRPGSEKWTSSFLAERYCATRPALRISTTKLTACTAGCELVLHNTNFLRVSASDFWRPVAVASVAKKWLSHYRATVLPHGAHFWDKDDDRLWWRGKISASTTTEGILGAFWG